MQTRRELIGEVRSPDLPKEIKFLRSGYAKDFPIESTKLFETVRQVIESLAGHPIIIFKEDKAKKYIEGAFHQFVKYRNPKEVKGYQPRADYTPLARFNLRISVLDTTDVDDNMRKESKLIFYPSAGINSSSPSRAFFHLHAAEFFRHVDNLVNSRS